MRGDMTKREKEWLLSGGFSLFLGMILIISMFGFYRSITKGSNIFNQVKEKSIAWQQEQTGYLLLYGDTGYIPANVALAGYLTDGYVVEQEFEVTEEMLSYDLLAFGVEMATYSRKNKSNLYVELCQEEEFSHLFKIDASTLKDNSDLEIPFSTEGLKQGICTVKIYGDAADEKNAVTMYTTTSVLFSDTMKIDGKTLNRNLIMKLYTPYGAKKAGNQEETEPFQPGEIG